MVLFAGTVCQILWKRHVFANPVTYSIMLLLLISTKATAKRSIP